MKIFATSDLHGNLPTFTEAFDLLLIAGDVCPAHDHFYAFQYEWLKNDFVDWVNSLPFVDNNSKVILSWGNHDFFGERASNIEFVEIEEKTNFRLRILRHDVYNHEYAVSDGVDSLKIFGTPYCTLFGNWPFMVNDETLEKKFSQIPDDVDILISHDSPTINKLGAILEGPWKNDNTGNRILDKHIERIKPKIFVSGHFHSGNHIPEVINGTMMANVSLVNEHYDTTHAILAMDYDEENRKIIGTGFVYPNY